MKIVFFGTAELSLTVLKSIYESQHKIVGIVTQMDKPSGRKKQITFSPVKQFAIDNNIPLFQFERVSRDGENELKALGADMFITASYGQILRQNIIDIAPCGIVNVHMSLLPKYRGSSPIQWAIINGEKYTGVTIMQTDIGIDTGDIFFSEKYEIDVNDTADSLSEKLSILGGEMIVKFLNNYNYYKELKLLQNQNDATYYPRIKYEDCKIDFNNSAATVHNFIRGNSSTSTAYFSINNINIQVQQSSVYNYECIGEPGTIIVASPKQGLVIQCESGAIKLDKIKPQGKKIMNGTDFVNGAKILVDAIANDDFKSN